MLEIELCGQPAKLLPDATLYLPLQKTLFLADPHFGKPEAFRALAVPVPQGTLAESLRRLSAALETTMAERLVILGDFWHAKTSRTKAVERELLAWRKVHPSVEMDVVLGNHDRAAGGPPEGFARWTSAEPLALPPFVAAHFPEPHHAGYVLAGHLHPGVTLQGRGRQRLRLPAFWVTPSFAVLPAFGEFTGKANVSPNPGDRMFVVAGAEVLAVPTDHFI